MKTGEKLKRTALFAIVSAGGFILGYDLIPEAIGSNDTLVNYLCDVFGELPLTIVVTGGFFFTRKYI